MDDEADYEFWTFNPNAEVNYQNFRPYWMTTDDDEMNTICIGDCFPATINAENKVWFDSSFDPLEGENFLINAMTPSDPTHEKNTYWTFKDDEGYDHHKVLFYDADYNSNKFQFDNLIIEPFNFVTCPDSTFPVALQSWLVQTEFCGPRR